VVQNFPYVYCCELACLYSDFIACNTSVPQSSTKEVILESLHQFIRESLA